ncbi:hypothetical protein BKA70DRAFT_1577128 [Coprinopsis sp. MPI-PUGE-AT-0042]|nr:hypothetical protein BKA70DRAFT_1577128 [Coprinopsis sp. MPI-PUGE-AT-0042]
MSLLKKLGRKIGGKRSKHGDEVHAATSDVQGGVKNKAICETESGTVAILEDTEREVALQSDKSLGEGTSTNLALGHTVNINGGTFTEIQSQINHFQYITSEEKNNKLFSTLNPVAAAHDCQEVASKVSECFAGTRQQLLLDIEKWRTTESSVPIFILDGIAGIGKTTVVKTVCTHAAAEHRLAASWFFSRDQQDRKSTRAFVGTLAYQLARYSPEFGERIAQALRDHPDILQNTIRAQFDTLTYEPLQAVLQELGGTRAISIDAIDECDLNEATEILSILLNTIPKYPQLRLLITCRPERPFRLLLDRHHSSHIFHLHEIENSVVESDIRLYINYRLSPEQVDAALPDLFPPPWRASASEKEALVQMAGKLFIVASTAVDFILDPKQLDPEGQMRHLLDASNGAGPASSPMDRLYTQVLRAAVPNPIRDWFDAYQVIVGAIVVAADVLPVPSLALLLNKKPNDIIRTLSHLHALIAPTNHSEAFRVHHKSFPDFITNPLRCSIDPRFVIDASAAHFYLARCCLRVMTQMLQQNICNLPLSDWSKELGELPLGTIDRIPPELAYACAHWTSHFHHGLSHFNDDGDFGLDGQLRIFVDEHLLSWLEVAALTGRFDTVWTSVDVLSEAISLVRPNATGMMPQNLSHVVNVLKDFLRFIALHPNLPRRCPLHIYLSSLPFTPRESLMRTLYARRLPKESVKVVSGIDLNWDPVAVMFKDTSKTYGMKVSPCSTTVAVISDGLRLHNIKSGAQIREFQCRNARIGRIAFSPDGHLIALGNDTGIYAWSVASGELIFELPTPKLPTLAFVVRVPLDGEADDEYEVPWLTSIAFTRDGTSIVAGGVDGTVFFWKIDGDRSPQHVLQTRKRDTVCECPPGGYLETCHTHYVLALIALPTPLPLILVTGSEVQFWALAPPNPLTIIPRMDVDVTHTCPVSFSLGKTMLAIESNPCTISIYSTSQPRCIAILSGHQGLITTTAFAPEPEELCSASQDFTVRIWDVTKATQLRIIPVWPNILTNAIFAKSIGSFIFRNEDRMVMLADDKCATFGPLLQRGDPWNLVRLSLDGSTAAIVASRYTVFSSVKDLTEAPPFDLDGFSYIAEFFPTGELITIWNKRLGFLDVVNSNVDGDGQVLTSRCLKIMGIDAEADSLVTSPDKSRVAVTGASLGVSVYNLNSRRLEAFLEPLPMYVDRDDSDLSRSFYAATLPPSLSQIQSCAQETPPLTVAMSKYDHSPDPPWGYPSAGRWAPPAHQLHFLSGDHAWLVQHRYSWTQIKPSSLPINIDTMAYSPNGSLVAVVGWFEYDAPRVNLSDTVAKLSRIQSNWDSGESSAWIRDGSPVHSFSSAYPGGPILHRAHELGHLDFGDRRELFLFGPSHFSETRSLL